MTGMKGRRSNNFRTRLFSHAVDDKSCEYGWGRRARCQHRSHCCQTVVASTSRAHNTRTCLRSRGSGPFVLCLATGQFGLHYLWQISPHFKKERKWAAVRLFVESNETPLRFYLVLLLFFSEAPSSCVRAHKFSTTVTLNSIVRGIKMSSEISRRDKKGGQFPRLKKRFTIQQTRCIVEGYVGHTGWVGDKGRLKDVFCLRKSGLNRSTN